MHNDLVTGRPALRRRDLLLVGELERVDAAQDLVELATGARRVLERQADRLLVVDDEDGTDGERETLLVEVGQVLLVKLFSNGEISQSRYCVFPLEENAASERTMS